VTAMGDHPTRPLSDGEMADRSVLLGALQCWTQYLSRVGWAATLPHAVRAGLAVELADRARGELTGGVRVAVHPPFALAYWATRMAPAGRADAVSLTTLVEALRFMGAQELGRFSPVGESRPAFPAIRAVGGWWNLGREVQRRLHQALYVPVLTARSGRAPGAGRAAAPGAGVRAAERLRVVADPALTVGLLRDYTRPERATALLRTALDQARPLCTRRAGRPPVGGSVLSVVTDSVLVALPGVSGYADRHRDRLGLAVSSPSAVRDALAAVREEQPRLLTAAASLSTVDSGGTQRRVADWWRVRLADLGHRDVESDGLVGEVAAWRVGRSQGEAVDALAERVRLAGLESAPRMPRGAGPEDVFPDLGGVYVFESDRAALSRAERAQRGLLYPDDN